MQIERLVFYHESGKIRNLPFELGKVNIITGESKTGKTALIDIIDYCLGSKDCKISEGVIREAVEWFGIVLQFEHDQVFIARQNPNRLGQASTNHIHFAQGDLVSIPALADLTINSNTVALLDFLTKKLLIAEYTNVPETGTRDPLSVTFKHSRFYSFQPQYLIAQRDFLFYNQAEQFVPQSMRDTLPYLLGAVREDSVRIEQQVAIKKRELSRLERELRSFEQLREDGSRSLFALVEEAKQLNLLSVDAIAENAEKAVELLRSVARINADFTEFTQGENATLKKLIDEKNDLAKELGKLTDDLEAVNGFLKQTSAYSAEATQQKARLESINLFRQNGTQAHNCPLCEQTIEHRVPAVEAITSSLEKLSDNLDNTMAERPKLSRYIERLELDVDNLRNEMEIKENGIRAIYLEEDQARQQRDLNLRRGKIIGRVSLFLESHREAEDDSELRKQIVQLKTDIAELLALISEEENETRLSSILNQINIQMSLWAPFLDLEHQNAPIRFDLKKLTIFADTPMKSIPLNQMGSGANWVAYHLLIHFALHKHFIGANRPTPRFLVLDQPSQIYYPPEKDEELKGIIEESSDEQAVRQMYDFIFRVTGELHPNFQVIVTDHAKLRSDAFAQAIREEWRNGLKLIPDDWIENA